MTSTQRHDATSDQRFRQATASRRPTAAGLTTILRMSVIVFLVVGLLASAAAPAAAAAGVVQSQDETPTATPTAGENGTAGTGPTMAEQARITAASFDKPYLGVERTDTDTWNTTGPYAIFAVSEGVAAARVTQPRAQATVMDGSRTIKVTYRPDAAPEGNPTFYEIEVFFEDGSTRTLTLYAHETEQVVVPPSVKKGEELIEIMREDATEHGYGASIDEVIAYHEWEKEQADLLNSLFSEQLKQFMVWLLITARTPFALLTIAAVLIYFLRRMVKSHAWKLTAQLQGGNGAEDLRRRVTENYRREQIAADEKRLEELDIIGPQWTAWQDAYGVSSVKQLADLFKDGQPKHDGEGNIVRNTDADPLKDADGDVLTTREGNPVYPPKMVHNGVDDLLAADDLTDTWLERIMRDERLGSSTSALAQAKAALLTITTEFGQSEYEETRSKVRELLAQEGGSDRSAALVAGSTQPSASAGGAATGGVGDD